MAHTSARNSSTAGKPRSELEAHAKRIRRDIAALADSVTDAGGAVAYNASSTAGRTAAELQKASQETVRELQAQLASVENRISDRIRERPLSSIALALGAGLALAFLMRR
jgi:ElaB/YqjD/DUF883 family membrane-anchored ribosome-binding protein